ncbi:LysR family transcriptional regulator [Paenibacillus sp. MZ04-78.2]|uniref:LysR family transcriptional regulator n=1 Tax=Paenibacillus sp. MZ04-78.2 TaxID=2962034 RepID=UPI0020B79E32|nr:LysR family transcriptional regulator [Paenibacillus sp. MZ04-78.2]MCP3773773.1 LysR family transcriptional regulator [Paenibacillus sp. MZ04-78.2]
MELLQLKYFQTVARHEHMTRAAEELCIVQPALSKMISHLEKELGVQLFDRVGKHIKLNQNGSVFLKHVEKALSSLEDGKRELADLSLEKHKYIDLAILVGSHILSDILVEFHKQYSNIGFHLLQHVSRSAIQPNFDLCISSAPFELQNIQSTPLVNEEIFLAVPANHRLAGRSSIQLQEAADEDFISLRPGKSLRGLTDDFCRLAGFTPRIVFETDDPATVSRLVKAGLGVAFIPGVSWGGATSSSVIRLHIEEPICQRILWLSWVRDRYLTESSRIFRQFMLDYFSKS